MVTKVGEEVEVKAYCPVVVAVKYWVSESGVEVEKYRKNLRRAFSTYLQTPVAAASVGTLSYILQRAV